MQTEFDIQFIQAFNKRDERSIEFIFYKYYSHLLWFAKQIIVNHEEAEDIVLKSFSKLFLSSHNFDSLQSIQAFLYLVTRNACYNYLKYSRRQSANIKVYHNYLTLEEDYKNIEEALMRVELLQVISNEIESLPRQCREVFELIFFEDLSVKEVAKRLNITVDTVRVNKFNALKFLKIRLLQSTIIIALTGIFCLSGFKFC